MSGSCGDGEGVCDGARTKGSSGTGEVVSPVRREVSCLSAATWLSVSGARGEPGDGFFSASRISWIPAKTRSEDEASGILTFVGNQEMVSQMRSARVSHTQMR